MSMIQIAWIIISIIAIVHITSLVMNFLGVGIEYYASYLIWIVALMILYGILPREPSNYFA